jgi:HAE1 family hydrophobic/amphiphilic exporter-1
MKIIELSVRRRVTIAMFTLGVLLFGAVSLSQLNINLLPDLSYPTLTVRTEYEGAAPAEVENLISKPIEEVVGVVKGVKKVTSISRPGQSDVTLEFTWGTEMEFAGLDVRERLDALQLPLDAERPVILRFDPTLDPIMRYAFYIDSGNSDSLKDQPVQLAGEVIDADQRVQQLKLLRRFSDDQLKKEIESADGVASVKISGGLEEEIQVNVDEKKLSALRIPITSVVQTLQQENVNMSGGRLEEGTQQYLVRTLNEFKSVDEINDIIIDFRENRPIYIRDVAEVSRGYKERDAISRLNGMEAVEIAIYKEGDANTVSVAEAVSFRMDQVKEMLPPGTKIEKVYDQSTFISQAVDEVVNAGLIGGLLAVIILFIFLRDLWSTVIISLSIPVSVIATFNLMYGNDISLNIMSLGGIALGIGLLVDNSIVVLENISKFREEGYSAREAASKGASGVGMAVVASTLTTVAVFFPLVFVEGIAGQLFRDQALTVTFSLLASLLVAITLIPMMASLGSEKADSFSHKTELKEPKTKFGGWLRAIRLFIFHTIPVYIMKAVKWVIHWIGKGISLIISPFLNAFEWGYGKVDAMYPKLISWSLRHRFVVLASALVIFAGTLLLIPRLGIELIPSLSQGEFNVELQLPPGTPIEETDKMIQSVQASANGIGEIQTSFAVAGTGNRMDANPNQGGENAGELNVRLQKPISENTEERAIEKLRMSLQNIPGLTYKFSRPALFTFATPIEVQVQGYNLNDLKSVSDKIVRQMGESGYFKDVKSTLEQGQPEIQITFDRDRLASMDMNTYDVARDVVSLIRGDVATQYSTRDRKIDILVRTRENDRTSVDDIRNLKINPSAERPLTLGSVADISIINGPGEIRRLSQQRVALINANLAQGDLGTAAEKLKEIIAAQTFPVGISVDIGGQNEDMQNSFQSLILALILAVFLVYLVMASQFESLLHPFVILFTIPMALIGAVWALWITDSTVSVVVFIGVIMLVGIVVNNAIVLIDSINQLREAGMEKMAAIKEGGKTRLRPILMTTLTTVLGLLPLSLGIGEGAEIRAPMGITVVGGMLVSMILTLIVIPVMYAIMDRKQYDNQSGSESSEPIQSEVVS